MTNHRMLLTVLAASVLGAGLARNAHAEEPVTTVTADPWAVANRWGVEAAAGLYGGVEDGYDDRLVQFGYSGGTVLLPGHYAVSGSWRYNKHLELLMDFSSLQSGSYFRDDTVDTRFSWDSHAATAFVRALAPTAHEGAALFAEAGAGLAWATSDYSKGPEANDYETQTGGTFAVGAGLRLMPWQRFGFVLKARHTWAPVLTNLYGETHDVGGTAVDLGLRVTF